MPDTASRLTLGLLLVCLPACVEARPSDRAASQHEPRQLVDRAAERPLRAGFILVAGVYNTELVAPYDVFEHSATHAPAGLGIEVVTLSPDGGPVRTAEGLLIQPDHGFEDSPRLDIMVVPSASASRDGDLEDERLIAFVRETGRSALLVMSLCRGSFVLAEAGLLDGLAATTFPSDYETFARRFPDHDLRINVSFVHDGPALTSVGGARSFEAALHVVELLYGGEAAVGVARGLLVPWPPPPKSSMAPLIIDSSRRAAAAAR